ncbi:MAG TPA: UbiH/UbiF/VisC/COQ6 family ubiquinone biosynthesis hydroxylase [Geminicoccaceae bacterium]
MATDRRVDLIVVGGGLTGLTFAAAVAGAGLRTLLIEARPLEVRTDVGFDGRVTAVAPASRRLLEAIDVWPAVAAEAQPILDIAVREGGSPLEVHYDHAELGAPLGHIVENRILNSALIARLRALEGEVLESLAPASISDLERTEAEATVRLAGGGLARAPLVVGADGRGSTVRAAAGIPVRRHDYRQTALVATFAHTRPHHGVAVEHFFPSGPFAILPMTGQRSSIVWAAESGLARELIGLDDGAFTDEVWERFGDRLGDLDLVGPRFHYPLSLVRAERVAERRVALVGDAAQAIHPIAGQGWNLGLRDVAGLAEVVVDAARLGLDHGAPEVLARYARWRRFDAFALVAITDGLNRLFANDVLPLRLARDAGLGAVERIPPLKRFFMRHAAGVLGDLPRIMRGESL